MAEDRRTNFSEAREGLPTGEVHEPSDEEVKARGRRNIAIALSVLAFAAMIYLTTFLRLAENLKTGGNG